MKLIKMLKNMMIISRRLLFIRSHFMKLFVSLMFLIFISTASTIEAYCKLDDSYRPIITRFLEPYSEGVNKSSLKTLLELPQTCLIQFKNWRIVDHHCQGNGYSHYFKFFSEIRGLIPDTTFIMSFNDHPLVQKNQCTNKSLWKTCACDKGYQQPKEHPLFKKDIMNYGWKYNRLPLFGSTVIPECFRDIPFPSPMHLNIWDKAPQRVIWDKKQFKAFWRGSTTGTFCRNLPQCQPFPRFRLVNICQAIPDCDAKFTQILQCSGQGCKQISQRYPPVPGINMNLQSAYKIILDIDGNSYSGRFAYLLKTGSLVLKIAGVLDLGMLVTQPWRHYIPIKMDLTDLEQKMRWVKDHDSNANLIATRGMLTVDKVFTRKALQCYVIHLLTEYTKLLINQ